MRHYSGVPETENRQAIPFQEQLSEKGFLVPARPGYATVPLKDGFDLKKAYALLSEALSLPEGAELCVIAFRSQQKDDIDEAGYGAFIAADDVANAVTKRDYPESFLDYFKGIPDAEGNCISVCLWTNYEDAKLSARSPEHKLAAKFSNAVYVDHSLERYWLDADGNLEPILPDYRAVGQASLHETQPQPAF